MLGEVQLKVVLYKKCSNYQGKKVRLFSPLVTDQTAKNQWPYEGYGHNFVSAPLN